MTATFMNAFNEVFAFCPCLKEAWGCTPPLVEYIAIVEPARQYSNLGNVAAGKGYDHLSTNRRWIRTRKVSQGHMT